MVDLILKPGREKSVLRHHPWIYAGAIERIENSVAFGETVDIYSNRKQWLAKGAYSPYSQIAIRIWTWDESEPVNEVFFSNKIQAAITARKSLYDLGASNSYRLIHGESDGLPGLVVDMYDKVIVVQYLSAGVELWKPVIDKALSEETGLNYIYERSDADVRKLEGLPSRVGPVSNNSIPTQLVIQEHGLLYTVNIQTGHKTGFYFDQRHNRFVTRQLSEGRDILDCFCYTGGFSLNACIGRARSILAIDESADALDLARENIQLNQVLAENISLHKGDVFQALRALRDSNHSFDLIIMDPPKFAPTRAQVERASRGYKDINLLAMKLLRKGGILLTFSCSGGVGLELFDKIIAGAAVDSKLDFQIIGRLNQAADHPIATTFPEGSYLKGLILRRA